MSLGLFLRKRDIPRNMEYIRYSDFYFKEHLMEYLPKLEMDKTFERLMYAIDESKYIGDGNIVTNFNETASVDTLSSGCKTAVNVYKNPHKVIDAVLCGGNALDEIFKLNRGYILLEDRIPVVHPNEIDVVLYYGGNRYSCKSNVDLMNKIRDLEQGA